MACVLFAYFEHGFEVGEEDGGKNRRREEAELGEFGYCGWEHN
jgi:hypothetical protein